MSFWGTASEDLQGGGVFSVVVGLYDDLHVVIEGDEEAEKALQGELPEASRNKLENRKNQNPREWRPWYPTSRKEREKWGTQLVFEIDARRVPWSTQRNSRFLTGLDARFGMTRC